MVSTWEEQGTGGGEKKEVEGSAEENMKIVICETWIYLFSVEMFFSVA